MATGGLLIINGDDWGASETTTDGILRCVEAGAVTSVSGMVFMADSGRAAQIARERGLPVGLHLNLTEPFGGSDLDATVRDRQAQIAERLRTGRRAGSIWAPGWFSDLERCIADQLVEFERLYAARPSHVDGHEHVHHSLPVLASRTLTRGMRMRPTFTYMPGEKPRANRLARWLANRVLRTRFRTPRYFFSIRDMDPRLGGRDLEEKLALSGGSAVEVMTHPSWDDEQAILLDPGWLTLIGARPVGSYRDL